MEEIPVNSPVEVGSLSHCLQGFIPSRWFSRRISEPSTVCVNCHPQKNINNHFFSPFCHQEYPSSFNDHMGPHHQTGESFVNINFFKGVRQGIWGQNPCRLVVFFSNTRLSSRCFPLIWFAQGTCGICLWCWVPFGNSWRLARCFQDEGARLIDLSKPHLCLVKVWEIRLIMVDQGWFRLIMIKVDYDDDFINDSDSVGVGARNFIIIIMVFMVFDHVFFNDDDYLPWSRLIVRIHDASSHSRWCLGRWLCSECSRWGLAICLPDSVLYVFVELFEAYQEKIYMYVRNYAILWRCPPPRNSQWQVRFIDDPLQKMY